MNRSADELLHLPVRLHGIQLGRPVDVVLDPHARRAIGFDVLCGDEVHRFLPFGAAVLGAEGLAVDSALVLLEDVPSSFQRRDARTLRGLLGRAVEYRGQPAGRLRDLMLDGDGVVQEIVVGAGDAVEHVPAVEAVVASGKAA